MVRVMIADDEQYEREYLNQFIAEHYAGILQVVYSAKDGTEVLEKAKELRPDIILLDIRMPRLNGLEAAEEIKRRYPQSRTDYYFLPTENFLMRNRRLSLG